MAAFRLFGKTLPFHFDLLGRKRKYIKSKTTANGEKNIHRRGQRHTVNHISEPPSFSLPTTFKRSKNLFFSSRRPQLKFGNSPK
jgi:hypothetical protein